MKSLKGYGNHFLDALIENRMPLTELAIMVSFIVMCLILVVDNNMGGELSGRHELDIARQQAHQELMALRPTSESR